MKQISLLTISVFLICIKAEAQNQVKISGNACVGSILAAHINGVAPEKIEWELNGKIIASQGSARQGITVAGGNGAGSGANQLYYPNGVFVDKDDNIWVADASNGRVQKFTPGNPNAETIGGNLPNHPTFPVNVVVCPKTDAVYVADYFEGKVKRLTKNGTEWVNVAGQNDELDLVRGVWVDSNENVYCTQYGYYFNGKGGRLNGMILKYPKNSSAWQIMAGGNGAGSGLNQFSIPTSVMLDDDGNIYVADGLNDHGMDNARVMKWAPGATQGVVVVGGNGIGHAKNQCAYPEHAFVDNDGAIYVSNLDPYDEIQKWPVDATRGYVVAGGNGAGNGADQFQGPYAIYKKGRYLYVCDNYNCRIQRFDLTESNHLTQFTARHPGTYNAVVTFEDGSSVVSNSIKISSCNQSVEVSDDAVMTKDNKATNVVAYPNPATNTINVNYAAEKSAQYLFEIVDMSGRILLQKNINSIQGSNHAMFDVSRFAKGLYFINIIHPDKSKECIRINKE